MRCAQHIKLTTKNEIVKINSPLPSIWSKAAGLLKNKKINALKHQKKIRNEWEKRAKKLEKAFLN